MEGEESGLSPGEPELALRRCLDARTRRWAAAEFFYSAVDRPWFMQNELKVYFFASWRPFSGGLAPLSTCCMLSLSW